ncbi:MAG: PorT family protein [Bacteroidales bacterium]|nr:PorT family protein [Bacteroidales bacterium]
MIRYIIFTFFLFSVFGAFAQQTEELDTNYYSPMLERDTLRSTHVGMKVGGIVQGVKYKANASKEYTDSIGSWSSQNRLGFMFALILEIKLNPHWNMETGMSIVSSKIGIKAHHELETVDGTSNYSTLQIPVWINYSPKVAANRMYFGVGANFAVEISKRDERYNRLIRYNGTNMLVGVGMGYRFQLPSKANLDVGVQLHYGLLNMVDDVDNYYNDAMTSMNNWDVTFYIAIN